MTTLPITESELRRIMDEAYERGRRAGYSEGYADGAIGARYNGEGTSESGRQRRNSNEEMSYVRRD